MEHLRRSRSTGTLPTSNPPVVNAPPTPGRLAKLQATFFGRPKVLSRGPQNENSSAGGPEVVPSAGPRVRPDNVSELPSIERYEGTEQTTIPVAMDQAHVLDCKTRGETGLYTTGAGPCIILAAVVRGADRKATRIALAHVSASAPVQSLEALITSLRGVPPQAGESVEVSLLGGIPEIAEVAREAAVNTRARVVFSHAGQWTFDQPRSNMCAACIDRDGTVYFGRRGDLEQPVFDASRLAQSAPRLEPLPITRHS